MSLLTTSATTTFMPRVKMSGQTVAAILTTLNNKFSGGMIQSLKEYLMALNNSFDKSVDSATARTPPGRDDIDDESSSGPVDSVTQIHFTSEHLTTEDSQMDGTLLCIMTSYTTWRLKIHRLNKEGKLCHVLTIHCTRWMTCLTISGRSLLTPVCGTVRGYLSKIAPTSRFVE